jgi:hypothetical protein
LDLQFKGRDRCEQVIMSVTGQQGRKKGKEAREGGRKIEGRRPKAERAIRPSAGGSCL